MSQNQSWATAHQGAQVRTFSGLTSRFKSLCSIRLLILSARTSFKKL